MRSNRAYDYPHVVAAYWTMYRLARNHPGLVTAQKWEWYLDKAFNTVKFMTGGFAPPGGRGGVGYVNVGLMNGDIFVMLLEDLKREAWKEQADYLEGAMKRRADRWKADAYPFGSEMAWDSTGQEEIYAWTNYFGYQGQGAGLAELDPRVHADGAALGLQRQRAAVLGLLLRRGAGRHDRAADSSLRVRPELRFRCSRSIASIRTTSTCCASATAASMGALSNIDEEGFPSAAFHSYPAESALGHVHRRLRPELLRSCGQRPARTSSIIPTTAGRRSAAT